MSPDPLADLNLGAGKVFRIMQGVLSFHLVFCPLPRLSAESLFKKPT